LRTDDAPTPGYARHTNKSLALLFSDGGRRNVFRHASVVLRTSIHYASYSRRQCRNMVERMVARYYTERRRVVIMRTRRGEARYVLLCAGEATAASQAGEEKRDEACGQRRCYSRRNTRRERAREYRQSAMTERRCGAKRRERLTLLLRHTVTRNTYPPSASTVGRHAGEGW